MPVFAYRVRASAGNEPRPVWCCPGRGYCFAAWPALGAPGGLRSEAPHTPRSVDSGLGKSTLHQLCVNTVVNRGCQTHALEGNIMPLAGPVSPHIHGSSSGTQGHDTAIPVPPVRG